MIYESEKVRSLGGVGWMSRKNQKKRKQRDYNLWNQIFSPKWVYQLIKTYDLDKGIKKLFFRTFIFFLLTTIILDAPQVASRDLESHSRRTKYKALTGIPTVSHSSICARLNRLPPVALDELLTHAQDYARQQIHAKSQTLPRMKAFDTTTWSVTHQHFDWAAHNGKRAAARFVFVMNYKTGLPERIVDASSSTSDNVVFEEVISQTRCGTIWVFDRGYSRLETIKRIVQRQGHFITRWSTSYSWIWLKKRQLRKDGLLTNGWVIIADEIGWVGASGNPGRAIYRRIICQHLETGKTFIIFTDLRKPRAAKLVEMYVLRWPIEVTFRHIKSSLKTMHFPSRSPHGLHNWLVIVALAIIFIDLLAHSAADNRLRGPMTPQYPFRESRRLTQELIENELFFDVFYTSKETFSSPKSLEMESEIFLMNTGAEALY